MIYRTFNEWLDLGFVVEFGQRSHRRNLDGKAVFSESQVVELGFDDEEEQAKDAHYGFDGW